MVSLMLVLTLWGLFGISADEGVGLDPNGGAQSAACTDEGVGVDPFGRPCTAQTLNGDEGNGFDPHG